MYPRRIVGVVGRNTEYGIEAISISCDQKYLASCSQTDIVQFWDLQYLYAVETDKTKVCFTNGYSPLLVFVKFKCSIIIIFNNL